MKTNAEIQEAALMHCPHPRGMRGDWMDGFIAGVQWIQSYPPACPHLKWVKSERCEAWSAEIFGIFYTVHLCTDGTYRAGSIGPKPQWFPTLEEAKAACEDHWAKYWEEEMKASRA